MSLYRVIMHYPDGSMEEDEEVFYSEASAEEHGRYMVECYSEGGDILHLSNPGDYPLETMDEADFEIVEID